MSAVDRAAKPIALLSHADRSEAEEPRQRPLDFRLIGRLMEFTRPYARQRNWLLLMVVFRSLQLPALTWVIAAIIKGPVARGDAIGLGVGAVGFALLALSTQVVMHFRQRLALELGEAVVFDLRQALFAHLQRMPLSWFHRTRIGRVISRMGSDIEEVRIGVQEVLFVSLVQVGQMLVAAIAMLWYDGVLFLMVLALAPVIWLINRGFHRRLSDALRAMRESFSRVTATLAESVLGVRVTASFVRQEENARLFRTLVEDHSRYNTRVLKTHGLFLPLLELNSQVFIAALLAVGGWRILSADSASSSASDVGDLIGFFFMANLFFAPISVLGNQYNQAMTAMAGAERLFSLLDTAPAWSDKPGAIEFSRIEGRVEFANVTFSYDPGRVVLDDVSFIAEAGQTIALVGHTGGGKSTIASLIAKFYLPDSGRIVVDGIDLAAASGDSLHRQTGIVPQQNFLFHGTVAENIRFGKPAATDDEILQTIHKLDCADMLEKLPDGLATRVGERGASLSAGQRQLVCFARALIADPRILILDEATSSVDAETERRLQTALAALLAGRTSFVIAHRLSTIRHADQVLVLDRGRIVERGKHDELLALDGVYAELYHRFSRVA